jgi:hypothetical protein
MNQTICYSREEEQHSQRARAIVNGRPIRIRKTLIPDETSPRPNDKKKGIYEHSKVSLAVGNANRALAQSVIIS